MPSMGAEEEWGIDDKQDAGFRFKKHKRRNFNLIKSGKMHK